MIELFKKKAAEPKEMTQEELETFYSRNRNKKVLATVLVPTAEEIKKKEVGL